MSRWAVEHIMPEMSEGTDEDGDLERPRGNQEIITDGRPAMRLQKDHEESKESKPDKNHHMDILEYGIESLD